MGRKNKGAVKKRIDILVVEKGLAPSRQKAQAMIMSGEVKVDGNVVTKAGHMIDADALIIAESNRLPFVSRGGLKLEAALKHFQVDITGKTAMDIGSSTGGFTDCLLQHGAARVYAIDVGYGLIDALLRNDPRVVLVERTNFRYIERERIPECADIITIDVSFISVLKILPRAVEFLCDGGSVLMLIKPQFEVGREHVGKGGIVRDEKKRQECVEHIVEEAALSGLTSQGIIESPIKGQKGNVEYFSYLRR